MAEADIASLIPDPMPEWLKRAMDSSTPTLDINGKPATVRTQSGYSEDLGGEVLFPTIRMG